MKDTLIKIKNNLQGNNSRADEAENQINDLEHKEEKKFNQNSKKKKRIQEHKDRLRSLWDNFRHTTIQIIGVLEGKEKEQEIGNLFEKIMKENFPNLVKEVNMEVQEAERVPNKKDAKRPTPIYIIIKMPKLKDKE